MNFTSIFAKSFSHSLIFNLLRFDRIRNLMLARKWINSLAYLVKLLNSILV